MTGVSFALFANDMTGGNLAGFRPPFSGNNIQKLSQTCVLKAFKNLCYF